MPMFAVYYSTGAAPPITKSLSSAPIPKDLMQLKQHYDICNAELQETKLLLQQSQSRVSGLEQQLSALQRRVQQHEMAGPAPPDAQPANVDVKQPQPDVIGKIARDKKRVETKPDEKKPTEKKPAEKKPTEKKPAEKKPAETKPDKASLVQQAKATLSIGRPSSEPKSRTACKYHAFGKCMRGDACAFDHTVAADTAPAPVPVSARVPASTAKMPLFFEAAKTGPSLRMLCDNFSFSGLQEYIVAGSDVNNLSPTETYLLHVALERQDRESVKLLLDHGADPNIPMGEKTVLNTEDDFWDLFRSARVPLTRRTIAEAVCCKPRPSQKCMMDVKLNWSEVDIESVMEAYSNERPYLVGDLDASQQAHAADWLASNWEANELFLNQAERDRSFSLKETSGDSEKSFPEPLIRCISALRCWIGLVNPQVLIFTAAFHRNLVLLELLKNGSARVNWSLHGSLRELLVQSHSVQRTLAPVKCELRSRNVLHAFLMGIKPLKTGYNPCNPTAAAAAQHVLRCLLSVITKADVDSAGDRGVTPLDLCAELPDGVQCKIHRYDIVCFAAGVVKRDLQHFVSSAK
eukprot:TRINITY_DN3202_c0_g1_i5.p1 TRINITY_DN3202_c0_g1~~TRINITY_DN3202_c0_g1_i5.p1  ORF type:complete len:576 (-),score=85.86 TRINITY_DN3202_c0_g1_i5:123-1850(-)